MKHTKGPWKCGIQRYGPLKIEIINAEGEAIASVWTKKPKDDPQTRSVTAPWPEGEANLNLILAAPDLLEALEEMLEDPSNDRFDAILTEDGYMLTPFQITERKARAAIARAKGQ